MMSEWAVWEKQNKKKRKQKTDLRLVGSFLSRLSLWEAERLCIVKRLKADLLFFLSLSLSLSKIFLSLSLFLSAKIIRSGFDLLAPLIHLFPALISLHFFSLSFSLSFFLSQFSLPTLLCSVSYHPTPPHTSLHHFTVSDPRSPDYPPEIFFF